MPSRRAFLGSLAAFALDPERLLWVPGKKLISIPAPPLRLITPELWFVCNMGGNVFYFSAPQNPNEWSA